MEPATRNSIIGGAVVAAAIVASVMLTQPPQNLPQKIYPRIIRPRSMGDAEWAAYRESFAKTNVPGTKMYVKVKK